MKRVIICAILSGLAVLASVYSYIRVEQVSDGLDMRINAINEAISKEDGEAVTAQAEAISEYWDAEERVLTHFVRHSYIDAVTVSASRLPSLAKYGDYSEVSAELASILRQIEHLKSSEVLTLKNLMS